MSLQIVSDSLQWVLASTLVLAGILVVLIWVKNLTRKVTFLRLFIQLSSLVAIYYSFTMPLWILILMITIFVMTLFSGRFFCGWICPFGFYMDIVTHVRKILKIRYWTLSERVNLNLNRIRYVILIVILIIPLFIGALQPAINQTTLFLFLSGPFKPLDLLLGPLEPLVLPARGISAMGLSYPYTRDITYYITDPAFVATIVIYVFVAITLISAFMYRRLWCRFCPTGASIAILNKFRAFRWAPLLHINKVEEKCTKCGICKRVCPVQVTDVYEQKGGDIRTTVCMNCFRCVEMCPYEGTLKVNFAGKTAFKSRNWLEPSKLNEEV